MYHALIMAGGGGTRFWPRSRAKRPKQFLSFTGDRSLLQGTADRIAPLIPAERVWVLTGAAHVAEASRQLPDVPPAQMVGEPMGRDTAACIGLGAALVARTDPDATLLVLPADHVIEPAAEFQRACAAAAQFVAEFPNALFTFGIPPTYPATGYGYIHRGADVARRNAIPASRVLAFREKPDAELAERFVVSGQYDWNAGIFVWKCSAILGELKRQRPVLHAAVERIADAWGTPEQADVFRAEYEPLEKISIDYAVMEHAPDVMVVRAPFQWDDVGSWLALERRNPQDAGGNTVQGSHVGLRTNECVVVSDADHLIATIGVNNLLIVQDGDATLIADRREEATVKLLVDELKKRGLEKYL
ncbi:MAG TPA: mannose-1-phosphate guanylyltransferase [Fimbriiglobus sp.]|jgi:mannose-1-phosphate guanylyltransferase